MAKNKYSSFYYQQLVKYYTRLYGEGFGEAKADYEIRLTKEGFDVRSLRKLKMDFDINRNKRNVQVN